MESGLFSYVKMMIRQNSRDMPVCLVIYNETEYNTYVKYTDMEVSDMKGCMSTDLGIITIDPEVIAKYAGTVAVECFGIVGMAAVNMKDGLVHLLKKESLTRGIRVRISEDNHVSFELSYHCCVWRKYFSGYG